MKNLLNNLLDFFFPPSEESLRLRSLTPVELIDAVPEAETLPFPFITALFSYKDPLVKELVLSIKNKKDINAVECAGFALFKKLDEMKVGKALLIPIPISRRRRNERGYNQCELIINEICKLDLENKFEKRFDILKRSKHTAEQKHKNRSERLGSTGIFSVVKIETNMPLIIIDDVATTGSTLREAREALLEAGYANISALTLAH